MYTMQDRTPSVALVQQLLDELLEAKRKLSEKESENVCPLSSPVFGLSYANNPFLCCFPLLKLLSLPCHIPQSQYVPMTREPYARNRTPQTKQEELKAAAARTGQDIYMYRRQVAMLEAANREINTRLVKLEVSALMRAPTDCRRAFSSLPPASLPSLTCLLLHLAALLTLRARLLSCIRTAAVLVRQRKCRAGRHTPDHTDGFSAELVGLASGNLERIACSNQPDPPADCPWLRWHHHEGRGAGRGAAGKEKPGGRRGCSRNPSRL